MHEYENEAQITRDASEIWNGGACNPVAVCGRLHAAIRFYGNNGGWPNVTGKPAVLLMMDQLAHLVGYSSYADIEGASKVVAAELGR